MNCSDPKKKEKQEEKKKKNHTLHFSDTICFASFPLASLHFGKGLEKKKYFPQKCFMY